jgi:hypothetical protein
MIPAGMLSATLPLIVVGLTLLLFQLGLASFPGLVARANPSCRLETTQIVVLALTVIAGTLATAAVCYLARHNIDHLLIGLYAFVSLVLIVIDALSVALEL